MYEQLRNVKGFFVMQKMDLNTDKAIYEDTKGQVLMTVDSNGTAYDKDGEFMGTFNLNYPGNTWHYEGKDGVKIDTPYNQLFEKVEPFVVEKLFNK
jgi:hypothetical protein